MNKIMIAIGHDTLVKFITGQMDMLLLPSRPKFDTCYTVYLYADTGCPFNYSGRVVGEFFCPAIKAYERKRISYAGMSFVIPDIPQEDIDRSNMTYGQISRCANTLYGYPMQHAKLYTKYKQLSDFVQPCERYATNNRKVKGCNKYVTPSDCDKCGGFLEIKKLIRPIMYVEPKGEQHADY